MSFFVLVVFSLVLGASPIAINDEESLVDKACKQALNSSIMTNRTVKQLVKEYGYEFVNISSIEDISDIHNNSIIVVSGLIDMNGRSFNVPNNSILYFKRGSFTNGRIVGNNTRIISSNKRIFSPGTSTYHGYKKNGVYGYVSKHDRSVFISGTWSNKVVGSKWTGIKTRHPSKCQSIAINNHISLHSLEATVTFNKGQYYIYDKVRTNGHEIDFSSSELVSIDFSFVENNQLPLPIGATHDNLRSVYGLLDINDEKARISNVVINGRASSRLEDPILGSECLVSITRCKEGSLNNIKLIDAVDCAICTSDIENVTFNNLYIDGCGEHGFYTHAHRGTLSFNECKFVNCGNNASLYKNYGSASCFKAAGLRSHTPKELLNFKVHFNNCSFFASHNVPVVTTYGDVPNAEYVHCTWEGVNGYVTMNERFVEETGRLYEYVFYKCSNPCGSYNSSNVIRKLYSCTNVRNPFDDTIIVDSCEVLCCYNESRNQYSNYKGNREPLIIRNTSFSKGDEDVSIRSIVHNSRPIIFENCQWLFKPTKTNIHRGLYCIELCNDDGTASGTDYISFTNCVFNIEQYRLLSCKNTKVTLKDSEIKNAYGSFVKEIEKGNNVTILNLTGINASLILK